jgi:DNA-binding transcriptional regulator YhcF (GntR family)
LIVEVDTTSPTPPYEQIRAQLARMIGAGVLPAHTRLPSIRQLAADLGLAANTVARAYRELELEGLVTSRVRHGTTVVHPQRTLSRAEISRTLTEAARAYAAVANQLGVDEETAEAAVRTHLRDARA